MKLKDAFPILEAAFWAQQAIELKSAPGIGKSSIIRQFRDYMQNKLGQPVGLIEQFLSTMDSMDVMGLPYKDGDQSYFARPPIFPTAKQFPEGIPRYGILFLDELGQAPHAVVKPAARVLLERRIGDYTLDEFGHWAVFAASNRVQDQSGVQKELAFLQNRKMVINIEPDMDSFLDWGLANDVHPIALAFAKNRPGVVFMDELYDGKNQGSSWQGKPFCSPRSLVQTQAVLRKYGGTDENGMLPSDGPAMEMAAGWMGEGAARDFMQTIRMAGDLPSFADIVADPENAQVPERPDARYLISQILSHQVAKDNAMAVFKYIIRLPEEFQIITLRSALKRAPTLGDQAEFSAWLRKNQKLVLAVAGAG